MFKNTNINKKCYTIIFNKVIFIFCKDIQRLNQNYRILSLKISQYNKMINIIGLQYIKYYNQVQCDIHL